MLSLDAAERLARPAVRARLSDLPLIPEETRQRLVVGKGPGDGAWVFELYLPAERPEDAVVLVSTRVDWTTAVVEVQAFPERWLDDPPVGAGASSPIPSCIQYVGPPVSVGEMETAIERMFEAEHRGD